MKKIESKKSLRKLHIIKEKKTKRWAQWERLLLGWATTLQQGRKQKSIPGLIVKISNGKASEGRTEEKGSCIIIGWES